PSIDITECTACQHAAVYLAWFLDRAGRMIQPESGFGSKQDGRMWGGPAMARRGSTIQMVGILTMAALMASCSSVTTQTPPMLGFRSASPLLPIPADVDRIVVLYPRGE